MPSYKTLVKLVALGGTAFALIVNAHAFLPKNRVYMFEYAFTIKNIPQDASNIRVWVPQPAQNSNQMVEYFEDKDILPHTATRDRIYRNKMLYYSLPAREGREVRIDQHYKILRREFINKPNALFFRIETFKKAGLEKYLKADRFIVLTPKIRKMALEITEGKSGAIEKARAIYDYIYRNISYDKVIPGWGKGDIERVCIVKSGNCTDFHSLFVALARANGIPAKFVMGVPLSREKNGRTNSYHCWAEFYEPHYGWIPVDISQAVKDKSRHEYYFGAVDENRVEFTNGRDIILEPPQNNGGLNYFIFPYVEVDGRIYENIEVEFKYQELS